MPQNKAGRRAVALMSLLPFLMSAAPCHAAPPSPPDTTVKDLIERIDRGYVDERAVAALKAAAEAGSGPAAQRLAYLYMAGIGMEISYPQAYRWYCAAAIRNVPFAIDTAIKAFNRMTPASRVMAENLVATAFTPAEIARLDAMRPPNLPVQVSNPGSDNGSMTGDSSSK